MIPSRTYSDFPIKPNLHSKSSKQLVVHTSIDEDYLDKSQQKPSNTKMQ